MTEDRASGQQPHSTTDRIDAELAAMEDEAHAELLETDKLTSSAIQDALSLLRNPELPEHERHALLATLESLKESRRLAIEDWKRVIDGSRVVTEARMTADNNTVVNAIALAGLKQAKALERPTTVLARATVVLAGATVLLAFATVVLIWATLNA